ncbi:tetratricopeptide repeat protein [Capilliphycus salinus ALCB114379]|uniref:tetratricopeptide repeat protein n=1 Tax=Capilliphycus salinus TaxID=2768948 RepID=UPI0039A7712A
MKPLTAAAILTLAFSKSIEKNSEKLTEGGLQKLNDLRQLIGQKVRGKDQVEKAFQQLEQGLESDIDIQAVAAFLETAMNRDLEFSQQVQTLAQQINQELDNYSDLSPITEPNVAAFELSWEQLKQQPETQQLACLLSLFSPDEISWNLVEKVYQDWQGDEFDLENIKDGRCKLVELNLLQQTEQQTYCLYRLLREFFRNKLEKREDATVIKQAFVTTMVSIVRQIRLHITTEQVQQIEPAIKHIEEFANSFAELLSDEDLLTPFTRLAWFYQGQTLYSQAEFWLKKGLEMTKSRLGDENLDVATSLNNLALLYSLQGRYKEAEALLKQVLSMTQRLFQGDHSYIAQNLNNLAFWYNHQGRYSEAEPLYQQALAMYQRLFDGDHPDVVSSLNNLAYLYYSQGRYGEAEPLYQQALEIRKRLFDGDHPYVATSLNNLAYLYYSQGRYGEAEPLYQQALEIRKRLFDGDHPYVATSFNNLAELYHSQGRYSEAEPLYQQALEMRQRLFSGDHPEVISSLNNLAELYKSQGRYSEAERLYRQALSMLVKTVGENHPNTQTVWKNLIGFLIKVIQKNKTDELSDDEFIQSLVSQLEQE